MPTFRKSDLVAVALPPGPAWRDLIESAWESGAAILPVDHRLAPPEVAALLQEARPTAVLDGDGLARRGDGAPVEPGVALVVRTSGTQGRPRLAEIPHSALAAAVAGSADALSSAPGDPWLCCLPLGHIGGLLVVARSLLIGCPVAIHPRFDPEAIAAEPGVAFVSVVPTMLARLLDAGCDLARFRAILVGGAALPDGLAARGAEAGARIVATYGLTESCGGVVYDGFPLRGVEVRIGSDDEVCLRGATLMRGYRLRREETAAAFENGWLRTADSGAFDECHRLRVLGRLDDAIVTGGEKVWPEEVEAVLREHPAIADVMVAGREDPEWGQRVVAFVVPADPAAPPSPAVVRDFVASRLARHKAPSALEIVEQLPRTASGKLMRAAPSRRENTGHVPPPAHRS